jgi:hypothetical protein
MLNQTGNEQRLAHHSAHQWALGVLRHVVSDGIFFVMLLFCLAIVAELPFR